MSFKVVIVKTKPQSLKQAEQFLRNRQWQVFSTINIRDAIAAIIQRQPDFILVAADHPNKKVRILPKLIGQAFPVQVVGYVESTSNSGMALLHECGLEYNVYPPVSGPAIERMILKIKKDEERREQERLKEKENPLVVNESDVQSIKDARSSASGYTTSSTTISGGGNAFNSSQHISAREMLQRLANDDDSFENSDSAILSNTAPSSSDDPGYLVQKGQGMGSKPNLHNDPNSPDSHNNAYSEGAGRHPANPQSQNHEGSGSGSAFADRQADSLLAKPYESNWEMETPSPENAEENKSAAKPQAQYHDDMAPGNWGQDKTPILEHDPIDLRKSRKQPEYRQEPGNYPDRDSIFVRGTQQALDESVVHKTPDESFEGLDTSSNVACITIQSQRFSGYLVAAMGKNRQIDGNFLGVVKERLFSFLRTNGENVKDDDAMDLNLESVDFEDWAIHQAEFLRKSVHGDNEIAMAFFPSKDTSARLEASANENMLKLSIEELRDDVKVDFDLYIYMPTNQKYILYTPQGRTLFSQQRGRLSEKGITHMHLRKGSEGQVKRYRAQSYLNDCIANYKSRPKVKAAQ